MFCSQHALPTCICHARPLVRPTVVINCAVLVQIYWRIDVCGAHAPTPRRPAAVKRNGRDADRVSSHAGAAGFVGAYSAHWTSLFSRRPSSRHFYVTTRCAPQQPTGDDVPMQPPGVVIMTVIKQPWLHPPGVQQEENNSWHMCKNTKTKGMAKIPPLVI